MWAVRNIVQGNLCSHLYTAPEETISCFKFRFHPCDFNCWLIRSLTSVWQLRLSSIYCVTPVVGKGKFDLFWLPPDKFFLTSVLAKHLSHFLSPVVFRNSTLTASSTHEVFPLFQYSCYCIPAMNEDFLLSPLCFSLCTRSPKTSPRILKTYIWIQMVRACQALITGFINFLNFLHYNLPNLTTLSL